MKRLINEEYDSYNDCANQVDKEIRDAVEPIIKKWMKEGYSSVDIEFVATNTISLICIFERAYGCIESKKRKG